MAVVLRLFDASPAWSIEDNTLIGYDLSFTQGLRLTPIDAACMPDDAISGVSGQLAEALSRIPAGGVVRFHSVAIDGYQQCLDAYVRQYDDHPIGCYVAHEKAQQCVGKLAPLRRELYCFVSTPPLRKFMPQAPRLLVGRGADKLLKRAQQVHHSKLCDVSRLRGTVARGLRSAGIRTTELGRDGLFDVVWRLANPSQAHVATRPRYRPEYTLRSQLFSSGIRNFHDCFYRDGRYHRVVTMKLPPCTVTPRRIQDVLQTLPCAHQLVVTLRRISEQTAERNIQRVRNSGYELRRMMAKLHGEHKAASLPDHEASEQQRDAEDALARLKSGERLFELGIQVWFSASSIERLDRHSETLQSRFRDLGMAEIATEELRGRFAFLGLLPGHHSLIGAGRLHPMLSSRAADLLPVFGACPGAPKPTAWLTSRHGELVAFHPFGLPGLNAWNAIISAGTGSGKSFITKTLLQGWVTGGGRMVVVTLGRDYHRLAELLGGVVHDVSLEDPHLQLGPFPTLGQVRKSTSPKAIYEHISSIIAVMTHEDTQPLGRIGRRLIYRAVEALYQQGQEVSWSPTVCDWLEALETIAAGEPESRALAHRLAAQMRFWVDGAYGAAFKRNRPAQDNDKLTVWNLQDIESEDTRAVVLALISGNISQSIKAGRTVIVMDEVWSVLKSATGAALVESLYRTVRKEGSAIWSISQSVADFLALLEECRSAILGNSLLKLLLAHTKDEIPVLAKVLNLTDREAQLAASVRAKHGRYSEVLLMYGRARQVLRLTPSPLEYWIATSHKPDCLREGKALEHHPGRSRFDIIQQLARSYPHGVDDAHQNVA